MADGPDIYAEAQEVLTASEKLQRAGKTVSEIRKEMSEVSSAALEEAKTFRRVSNETIKILEKELAARDKILKSIEKQAEKQRRAIKPASTRAEQNEAKRKLNDILIKQLEQKLEFENKKLVKNNNLILNKDIYKEE